MADGKVTGRLAAIGNLGGSLSVPNTVIAKGFSPYIGENGHWFEYDDEQHQWIDTGVEAQGQDGTNGTDGVDGTDGVEGE